MKWQTQEQKVVLGTEIFSYLGTYTKTVSIKKIQGFEPQSSLWVEIHNQGQLGFGAFT